MMKFLVIFASFFVMAFAQRGSFAGSQPIGYPGLASRFKTDEDSPPSPSLNNRANVPNENIPVDARGDVDLVNRLNQWPRENRPFWILNADHIEAQRDPQGTRQAMLSQRFGGAGAGSQDSTHHFHGYGYEQQAFRGGYRGRRDTYHYSPDDGHH